MIFNNSASVHLGRYLSLFIFIYFVSIFLIPGSKFDWKSLNFSETPNPRKRPIRVFIFSAYYYPQSKSLGDNALALVMSMNLGQIDENNENYQFIDFLNPAELALVARNKTAVVGGRASIEKMTLHRRCQMVTVFATVQILPNPIEISMISDEVLTEIPFKAVSYLKREVVVCISPLYVSEQWQNFLVAAHIYKQYGAHMHVYFVSAVTSFFQLMREYEKHDYITMQPWDRAMFPGVPGWIADTYQQIEFQNLAAAQTDCLLQYKEAAQFITLFDLNDILIPKLASTLLEEFEILMEGSSLVSFLTYPRENFEVTVFNNTRFSIQAIMNNLVDKNTKKSGRIVINPKNLNYTWMDRPLFVPYGYSSVDVTENFITHFDEIIWKNRTSSFNFSTYTDNIYKHSSLQIEADTRRMLKKPAISAVVPSLPNFYWFYDIVKKCFEENYHKRLRSKDKNQIEQICPGPQLCGFFQHPMVDCVHVNAMHRSRAALEAIMYYYATDYYYTADIGCYPQ